MAKELKKIEITLPQSLVDEMNYIAEHFGCDLNEVAVKALRAYVGKCKRIDLNS